MMHINDIKKHLFNPNIVLHGLRSHTKASEEYIDVGLIYPEEKEKFFISIPFHYRRCGLFIDNPEELSILIKTTYEAFKKITREKWVTKEKKLWEKEYSGKYVTKPFFDKLSNLKWNCAECDLPNNRNFARRIQDIKEMGYFLATHTKYHCRKCNKNTTHILLLPLEKGAQTGYEILSDTLKKKIIKILNGINAYENKKQPSIGSLIPDHKFPEIRWDEETKKENLETMSPIEIKKKFQLLDNQRNLQKREICRKCYQSGERGNVFGVNYYYEGDEKWPEETPKIGKNAEKGCIGCPWYDIQEWRENLNKKLTGK